MTNESIERSRKREREISASLDALRRAFDKLRRNVEFLERNAERATISETVVGVIPTSIVVGSGTASVADDGLITFTGVSSISLNDVFDGTGADTYKIVAVVEKSAPGSITTRMRSAGVDTVTGYNYVGQYTRNASGPTRSSIFGTSVFGHWSISVANSPLTSGVMHVFGPALAGGLMNIRLQSQIAASDRYVWDEFGDVPGEFDGFTMIATASGTLTGTLKVVKIA